MQESVTHSGVVVSVSGDSVVVRIEQLSACASCHAAAMCNASDKKEKLIDAYNINGESISVGDKVQIKSGKQIKSAAVALAYILPLFIMVAVLFLSVVWLHVTETVAALISLAFVLLYFVVLWLFRGKLKSRFVFYVEKLAQD